LAAGGSVAPAALQGAGAIQHAPSVESARATLQSLSGQLHAASAAMLFDSMDASNNALAEHFDGLLNGRAKPGVWYANLGWQGSLQRDGYAGTTFRSSGSMAGADVRVGSHALLGYAVGASQGYGQLNAAWDHNQTWAEHATVYGGVVHGAWYALAQVGGGQFHEDMQRLLLLGSLTAPVGSRLAGSYVAGSVETGYQIRAAGLQVTPFADVRYQRLHQGAFAEQGGYGFGLMADAHAVGRLQGGLGLRTQRNWRMANGMWLQFEGSAAWRHALHQYGDVFDASFTGFDDWMPVSGVGLSRDESVLRAGLTLWPTDNFDLRLGYTREQGSRQQADSVMLQGAIAF
jgi:fibronectin-binding autotransporter adhesin